MKSTPITISTIPGDLAQQDAVLLERLAEAGGRHPQGHEHRGEGEAEEQRRARARASGPVPPGCPRRTRRRWWRGSPGTSGRTQGETKEMKPTPKAATTVVSTVSAAITGRSARGRRPGARCPRRRGRPCCAGESSPRRRQRRVATSTPPSASTTPSAGDHVHEHVPEVGVLVAGQGQHAVAELGHQGALDLVLGAAGVHLALDERALAVGLRSLGGQRERRAAHRAHHLVLHVGQGGLRAVGGQRGRCGGEQRRGGQEAGQRAPHAASLRSGATVRRRNSSSTGPRCRAATRPRGRSRRSRGSPARRTARAGRPGRRGASGR